MSQNTLKTAAIDPLIPSYLCPVSDRVIATENNKLLMTVKLQGVNFESESDKVLEQKFETIRNFFSTFAKQFAPNLAVWTHIVKSKSELNTEPYKFNSTFVKDFSEHYFKTFKNSDFFKVNYYITFVLNSKLKSGALDSSLDVLKDIEKQTLSALKKYSPETLTYDVEQSSLKNAEFLSYLLNHSKNPTPLSNTKIKDTIQKSDWHFGYDCLEIRNNNNSECKFASFYELDSYPAYSECGMFDFILHHHSEFVLTQSMIFTTVSDANFKIGQQINMINSSDGNENDLEELDTGRKSLSSGEINFGDYHFSLAVFGDTPSQCLDHSSDLASEFQSRGTILKRSNINSVYTMVSSLPASKIRPVSSPKTTTNLSCGFSLHNFSAGKKFGNPIGDGSALMPLKTLSNSLFYLNCHASDLDKNVTGQKFAGHTLCLGASGTGKTTLEGVLTLFLTRFEPQVFAIDYNRSTELYIRAIGGEYFAFREGESTGLNPFQLDDNLELRSFLYRLVNSIAAQTPNDELELKNAIDSVMTLPFEYRRLSTVLQSVQSPDLRVRLAKWCESEGGQLGWCLDSPVNKFNPDSVDRVGFDTTLLLETDSSGKPHQATEAILATLFYLKELMQKEGRLLFTIVEEFWMPANFPLTQQLMKRILKAGRLKNEFMFLASQSPEDAVQCEIFAAIVQQTATKIFLPNPDAEYDGYRACGLNQGEFNKLKALDKQSRTFLIKQSNVSAFAKLDLYGFDKYLPIISGTTDTILACETIRKEQGTDDPEVWIPLLQEQFS